MCISFVARTRSISRGEFFSLVFSSFAAAFGVGWDGTGGVMEWGYGWEWEMAGERDREAVKRRGGSGDGDGESCECEVGIGHMGLRNRVAD